MNYLTSANATLSKNKQILCLIQVVKHSKHFSHAKEYHYFGHRDC